LPRLRQNLVKHAPEIDDRARDPRCRRKENALLPCAVNRRGRWLRRRRAGVARSRARLP
jgi:hypothetical protein